MFATIANVFKAPDLRNKILFTLAMIVLYRLGAQLPSPGVDLDEVTPEALFGRSLISKGALVKVLGRGELNRPVTVRAHAFSRSAEQAITAAGGSVDVIPPPFGNGRPAAKGNALTNR